jgi:hypothetical protein
MRVPGFDVDRALRLPGEDVIFREIGGAIEHGLKVLGGEQIPARLPISAQVLWALIGGETQDLEDVATLRRPGLIEESGCGEKEKGAGTMETVFTQTAAELDDVFGPRSGARRDRHHRLWAG